MRVVIGFVLTFIFYSQSVHAEQRDIDLKPVTTGLGVVWAMDFVNQHQIIFTLREGRAGLLDLQTNSVIHLQGLPEVHDFGQGGLLDVAVPPNYQEAGWIYFTYSKPDLFKAKTTLARAKLSEGQLVEWHDLLVTQSASIRNIHFGSRIAFDDQGHLFFTVGDRGHRPNGQDLTNHAGTVIRLNMDGSVPKDNPFVNDSTKLDEIWSYGHRNPQGLTYDSESGHLWLIEHGPRGGDEINLIEKSKNYGWPIVSQGKEYFSGSAVGVRHQTGMQDPVKVYIPSIAPSDLLVYRGEMFKEWRGDLLTGALKLQHVNRVVLNKQHEAIEEHRLLENLQQRVRSLLQGEDGELYIGTDSGVIYRLTVRDQ